MVNFRWFALAAVSLVLGIIAFVAILIVGMGGAVAGLERLEILEITEIELARVGTYTVFWENELPRDLQFTLLDSSANQEIVLTTPRFNSRYSHGGQKGKALFEFTIDQPGTYAVYTTGSLPERAIMALGRDFNRQMAYSIFWAILVLLLSLVITGILVFKRLQLSIEGILREK